ncbi:hypothetical protein Tco_0300298 [Tanacetum coccineum]
MKALIKDENAMDKGVADTIKNHKIQHDDDEDPSIRLNQGKKTKRIRTKESESSMKPSTTKETSKGKASSKSSKTGKSATAQEPSNEPITEVVMDDLETTANEDVVNDVDFPQDYLAPKTNKPSRRHDRNAKDPLIFDELMAIPIDFSKYAINRLQIDNLTQEILVGPDYNLLKGTCTSRIELEYNMEECYKALIERLDWNNPEGDPCPFDLTKPLPLKDPKKKYTTSITKTKAARYEIVGIKDMVPTLWITTKVGSEIVGIEYMVPTLLSVVSVSVKKLHGYGYLEEILVRIADRQVYNPSCLQKLIIKRQVEDLQLGVESYQKKLNIIAPQKTFPEIEFKELYTPSYKPPGVIYEDLNKQKRVMRVDELYKFLDGTLKIVCDELHYRILDFRLGYNKEMSRRKWTAIEKRRSELMVKLIDKQMRERRIIRNLERLMGSRELEMDYRLMTRTD